MGIIETIEDITGGIDNLAAYLLHRAHAADQLAPIEFDEGGWASGDNVTCFRKADVFVGGVKTGSTPETLKQQVLAPGLDHVEGLVWHYTDTRGCGADALARRLIDPKNTRAASWHACIDATGHISQSVSAKCGSWHAGGADAALFTRDSQGVWSMLEAAQRGKVRGWSANSWTFGVELENAGELRLIKDTRASAVADLWCSWPFKFGSQYGPPIVVPEAEVFVDKPGHGWHMFTDPQVQGATRLLAGLVGRYGLRREACAWTHAVIDPQNRVDPGADWTLPSHGHLPVILDAVFGAG